MRIREVPGLFKAAAGQWSADRVSRHAAALSYYTVFSLAPLLVIIIGIAGLVFGAEAARNQLDDQIAGLIGKEGAEAIQSMVAGASKPKAGIIATIAGGVILLLGASGVFGQLHDSLNEIWDVKPKPGLGLKGLIKQRLLSFSMVFGIGFLLLVSLALSALLAAFSGYIAGLLPLGQVFARGLDLVVSLAVVSLLFAMMFKILPDAKVRWKDAWFGALVTSVLFSIGRYLIGLYLGHSSVGSAFGAAGSLVIVLVWVYYSSQILFFGAEFTKVYANSLGSLLRPKLDAVAVRKEERMLPEGEPVPKEESETHLPSGVPGGVETPSAEGEKAPAPRERGGRPERRPPLKPGRPGRRPISAGVMLITAWKARRLLAGAGGFALFLAVSAAKRGGKRLLREGIRKAVAGGLRGRLKVG